MEIVSKEKQQPQFASICIHEESCDEADYADYPALTKDDLEALRALNPQEPMAVFGDFL